MKTPYIFLTRLFENTFIISILSLVLSITLIIYHLISRITFLGFSDPYHNFYTIAWVFVYCVIISVIISKTLQLRFREIVFMMLTLILLFDILYLVFGVWIDNMIYSFVDSRSFLGEWAGWLQLLCVTFFATLLGSSFTKALRNKALVNVVSTRRWVFLLFILIIVTSVYFFAVGFSLYFI